MRLSGDAFRLAPTHFEEATSVDIENHNACWGRVAYLDDAKVGDIIVYRHNDNRADTEVCSDGKALTKGTCIKRQ